MRFLIRLYPPAWRERYGEEYEALLADRSGGLRDGVDIARGALDAQLHVRLRARRRGYRKGNNMWLERDALRDDLRAMLAARDEPGPEHERELVESFLDSLGERGVPSRRAAGASNRAHLPALVRAVWWLVALLALWVLAGVSSVAIGVPWSLSSTAPAQVLAAGMASGYALVLTVLLIVCCLALIVSFARRPAGSSRPVTY